MPELPEVETIRRGLARYVRDQRIEDVAVLHPRAIRRHTPGAADFIARLRGQTLLEPARRGKYLWIPLADGQALIAHLGMSGQFKVAVERLDDEPHVRVRLVMSSGQHVHFLDQRTFGGFFIDDLDDRSVPVSLAHIARDPFDRAFDIDDVGRRMRSRHQPVKRALLDQTLVSGIGNIYADEALWRARVHFGRGTERLSKAQAIRVLAESKSVMTEALEQGGTSFDALYVNVNGESGYYDRSLEVYGREGLPCSRCGSPIRRVAFANRSSYFCPRCQSAPRATTRRTAPRARLEGDQPPREC